MSNRMSLLEGDIKKIFFKYLIPAVGGMLGTSLYVLGDTMIVGRGLGSQGLAALNVSIPLNNVFNGMIKWNNEMVAIKKAKEITKNAKTDLEKSRIIYDYITQNIKYDNQKANTVQAGYIPSVDQTLSTASGICFDYAVLYAAMMRSVDVPTKMVMGYNKDITSYHSWNEVYLKETDKWVTIDTTYDAGSVESGSAMKMIKNNNDYKIEKIY